MPMWEEEPMWCWWWAQQFGIGGRGGHQGQAATRYTGKAEVEVLNDGCIKIIKGA